MPLRFRLLCRQPANICFDNIKIHLLLQCLMVSRRVRRIHISNWFTATKVLFPTLRMVTTLISIGFNSVTVPEVEKYQKKWYKFSMIYLRTHIFLYVYIYFLKILRNNFSKWLFIRLFYVLTAIQNVLL